MTRCAVATEAEAKKQGGDNRTMGRKFTVPYRLYRAHAFISAHLAGQTKFNESDLELLWDALKNMFEHDHSAARGEMIYPWSLMNSGTIAPWGTSRQLMRYLTVSRSSERIGKVL